MKPTIISITLSFCLILSQGACKKEDNPIVPPSPPSELMPLKVGNIWTFTVLQFDSSGRMVDSTAVRTIEVYGDTVLEGRAWYQLALSQFQANLSDGLNLWVGFPRLIYKYPATVGDSVDTGSAMVTIVSVNESKTVPAGTYSCYHYRARFYESGNQLNDYYAPGIGPISFETGTTQNGKSYIQARWILKHVTLK